MARHFQASSGTFLESDMGAVSETVRSTLTAEFTLTPLARVTGHLPKSGQVRPTPPVAATAATGFHPSGRVAPPETPHPTPPPPAAFRQGRRALPAARAPRR